MREAMFWKKEKRVVHCSLCYRNCRINDGRFGFCGIRKNENGRLFAMTYGKACAAFVDPIEKKPFYHFHPGENAFSIATVGCNFRCLHCFVPDTPVITDKGVFGIEHLVENRESASILTRSSSFMPIKNKFVHEYSGEVVKIEPHFLPNITCTPDHKIFATDEPLKKEPFKIMAAELSKKHFLVVPKLHAGASEGSLDVKKILSDYVPEPFKVSRRKITEDDFEKIMKMKKEGKTSREIAQAYLTNPAFIRNLFTKHKKSGAGMFDATFSISFVEQDGYVRMKGEKNRGVRKRIKITPELARLSGLYCAEGCVRKARGRKNAFDTVFSFGHHEKKLARETAFLLKVVFGAGSKIKKEQTALKVYASGSSMALFFKISCGSCSKNKKVPSFLFNSSKKVIGSFLKGYFDGDGAYLKQYSEISTISRRLSLGTAVLIMKQGTLPYFYNYPPYGKSIKEFKEINPVYLVRVPSCFDFEKGKWARPFKRRYLEDDKNYYVPISKVSKEHYTGKVYNLEVEKDHSYTASFAAVCNCQNYEISQQPFSGVQEIDLPPEKAVSTARDYFTNIIAYTYTEPTVFYEYAHDTGVIARKKGMKNVFVTNGYAQTPMIKNAAKDFLDAARIDLKGDEEHYKKVCGNVILEDVLRCIKDYYKTGMHVEIITLVIAGDNDNRAFVSRMASFLKGLGRNGKNIPWHFIQFFPTYKMMSTPRTPVETLAKMRNWAKDEGMNYVYTGNVPGHSMESTYCPNCSKLLIERYGFNTPKINLTSKNKCPECGEKIPIVL